MQAQGKRASEVQTRRSSVVLKSGHIWNGKGFLDIIAANSSPVETVEKEKKKKEKTLSPDTEAPQLPSTIPSHSIIEPSRHRAPEPSSSPAIIELPSQGIILLASRHQAQAAEAQAQVQPSNHSHSRPKFLHRWYVDSPEGMSTQRRQDPAEKQKAFPGDAGGSPGIFSLIKAWYEGVQAVPEIFHSDLSQVTSVSCCCQTSSRMNYNLKDKRPHKYVV